MKKISSRALASQITYEVVYKNNNLSELFIQRLDDQLSLQLKASVKSLCYETIRHFLLIQNIWLQALTKTPKDKMVRVILTQALVEYKYLNKPSHVIVNEAVKTAKTLKKQWACGLINSTLRKSLENIDNIPEPLEALYSHPQWWIDKLKQDWPEYWQSILIANNKKPPLWVRSNKPLKQYLSQHDSIKSAFIIEAQDIKQNSDFKSGNLSVQDASAQLAALILNPQNDENVLDACAAPGGKTCHLLEFNNKIVLDAVEIYPNRAKKIKENLKRLGFNANIKVADVTKINQWYKGHPYDKILLDVPCSASGIIRRQVDIKFNRKKEDLLNICLDQQQILEKITKTLKNKGKILYVTCSVFKQENSDQIKRFLKNHPEFSEIKLKYPFSTECEYGVQILTGAQNMDGFYYCYLEKNEI